MFVYMNHEFEEKIFSPAFLNWTEPITDYTHRIRKIYQKGDITDDL